MPKPSITRARHLRRTSTDAERLLWRLLRNHALGTKFRRQHPIGPYIADFASPTRHLIIEADGSQHANSEHDQTRTTHLSTLGWRLLRFWNNEILTNPTGVLQTIIIALADLPPILPESPKTPLPLSREREGPFAPAVGGEEGPTSLPKRPLPPSQRTPLPRLHPRLRLPILPILRHRRGLPRITDRQRNLHKPAAPQTRRNRQRHAAMHESATGNTFRNLRVKK